MTQKTAVPARRTQAERSGQATQALREAALLLLLRDGVAGFSLADVGDAAGYSRGIVHYHFGSRDALLADLLGALIESSMAAIGSITDMGADGLIAIVRLLERAAIEQPQASLARTLLLNEATNSSSPMLRGLAQRYNAAVRDAFRAHVEADPRFREAPATAAALLLATIRGIHHQWLAERDEFDVAAALHALGVQIARIAEAAEPRDD